MTPHSSGARACALLRSILLPVLVVGVMLAGRDASAAVVTFNSGSLIIPMDTGNPGFDDGQDDDMLRAYGLVYQLLRNHVPVYWTIDPMKSPNGNDFTLPAAGLSVLSVRNNAVVPLPRPYRGGPFIIAAADAAAALPIIAAWQATPGDETEVHQVVTGSFTPSDVPRALLRAPRLAVSLDGNEQIAFNNLNAAGIVDSVGGSWGYSSPDLLTEAQIVGPSTSNDADGVLFNPGGLPRYCNLISMHYVTTALTSEVVSEVRSWLNQGPLTHAFMQCEGARAFESDANGHFLTTNGIQDDGAGATSPINRFPSDPLTQIDGTFQVDSGLLDSIGLESGSVFKTGARTLFNENMTPLTQRITMLTGRMDGVTFPDIRGRVTYLTGHDYSVSMPVSSNPQTNGVRLMLNTIFESDCATAADPAPQDDVVLTKSAPALISSSQINYTITLSNPGPRPVENLKLTDVLPAGVTYINGSGVPAPTSVAGGVVTWNLPTLGSGALANVTFSVSVTADGTYLNDAELSFSHLTVRKVVSNTTTTVRDTGAPDVTIISGPSGLTNDSTPTFEFVNGDNTATVMECRITPGGSFVPCSESPASFTSPPLAPESYAFTVRVADAAGNESTASRSFEVDLDPPTVVFGINPVYTNLVRPTFVFSTFGGGVITSECLVTPTAPPRSFVPCSSPWQVPLPDLSDGNYLVQVVPTDEAGNVGATASHAFQVDTVPPEITLSPSNPTVTSDNTPAFSWTITPPGGSPVTSECRIDGGAWEPCTGAFVVPNSLADGFHTLQVKAQDAAGNQGVIVSHQFLVDTIAPVVVIPGPPQNETATDDPFPSFVFTVSPGGSDVSAQCRIIEVGSPLPAPYHACDFFTFTHPGPSGLSDGNYIFEVIATDAAGNFAAAEHPFAFTVDSVGPVVTIFAPPSNSLYTSDNTPDFGFSVSDGGSPTLVDCRVINLTPGPSTDTGFVPCVSRWTVPLSLSDAKYRLIVRATDGIPQVGADTFDFIVDTIAPVVTLDPSNPTISPTGSPTFLFTVSGGVDEAPAHSLCRIDSAAFAPCTTSSSYVTVPALTDGMHTFSVMATDEAGNIGDVVTHPFVVDTIAPTVVIDPEPTVTNDPTPGFTFEVLPGGTATSVSCQILQGVTVIADITPCASGFSVPLPLDEGIYELRVTASDAAGHSHTDNHLFEIDLTPPAVTIISGPIGPTGDTTPTFEFVTEAGAQSTCQLDAGPIVACVGQFTALTPLSEGPHTFTVRATDAAGNVASATRSFSVELTAPTPTPTATATPAPPSLCSGGPFVCKAPGLTTFALRNRANGERDTLKLTLSRGDATTTAELGDPAVDTEYAVCVWDHVANVPSLVMEMAAPFGGNCAGRPCWRPISGGGFRYKDPGLLPHGLQRMTLRPGALGKTSIKVKGKGLPLPDPSMPFQHDPSITVQVVNDIGNCWGAEYVSPPRVNTGEKLLVKERP